MIARETLEAVIYFTALAVVVAVFFNVGRHL
jgi:hypothetical protein